jgi:hypothetical protein
MPKNLLFADTVNQMAGFSISDIFPLIWVDLATFTTLLPFYIFYYASLTSTLYLRSEVPVLGLTLTEHDYYSKLFTDYSHMGCFIVWTFQVILNVFVIYYHVTRPHHPKFYSTTANKVSIICHMIGGIVAVNGLYFGTLLNRKEVCIIAAGAGAFLHLPTVAWNNRNTCGQREMSAPMYFMIWVILLTSYINFVLYDANFQTVFSLAMTLNIYSMVRLYAALSGPMFSNLETNYDRSLICAGFSNISFAHGMFSPLYIIVGFHLWNIYFEFIKPYPRFMMRIQRGYWDAVPNEIEEKRGISFEEELQRQMETEKDEKEAIAKALWNIIVEDEEAMDIKHICELYQSWGMPDAKSAAKSTFERVDLDKNGEIEYDEFKKGFKHIIAGIFIVGEYEDTQRKGRRLEEKEMQ